MLWCAASFLFLVQKYPKNPHCLIKKFLRLAFKVLLCLIQTDVSRFHSQPENSYEVARPDDSASLDQASHSCLHVHSSFCFPSCIMPSFFFSSSNIPKPWFSLQPQLKCSLFLEVPTCLKGIASSQASTYKSRMAFIFYHDNAISVGSSSKAS